ncbi:jg25135 [Pararge aegeria aegeria]|uniref:Jg25135 protein n=1 Tax=Pararge aegeria aegeria TaxID=348720 RepID=A0A8S4SDR9_9NEOP|nr:jg25135 [Pararge aegeria aegeria]
MCHLMINEKPSPMHKHFAEHTNNTCCKVPPYDHQSEKVLRSRVPVITPVPLRQESSNVRMLLSGRKKKKKL